MPQSNFDLGPASFDQKESEFKSEKKIESANVDLVKEVKEENKISPYINISDTTNRDKLENAEKQTSDNKSESLGLLGEIKTLLNSFND